MSICLFYFKPPTTIPLTPIYIKSLTYSHIKSYYFYEYTNPLLWCLIITIVGILTLYKDLRIIFLDGVSPPIYNADTSYILSAPDYYIVKESKGDTDITSSNGILKWFTLRE